MIWRWLKLLEAVIDDKTTGGDSDVINDADPNVVKEDLKPDEQEPKQEEDVSKLDLKEPEHLQKFRASYATYKSGYEERGQEIEQLRQEIDSIRADQGKGVYLDTNVPLEDFNPDETLTRMAEEEPDYFQRLTESFMSAHFWPSVGQQFQSFEGKKLDVDNNPQDAEIVESMLTAWDAMSRRMYQLSGNTVDTIIHGLAQNPDLSDELYNRVNGRSSYRPEAPYTSSQPPAYPSSVPNNGYQSPVHLETVEQIATRLHLDPSEEIHLRHIQQIQAEQREKQAGQLRTQQMEQNFQAQLSQKDRELKELREKQQRASTVSDEDLAKQADQRINQLTSSALKDDIQRLYSNAVPKDKVGLLSTLEIVVDQRLRKDPIYMKAEKTAKGWFKQSMSAKTPQDRDRRDKQGIDALAVMVPIRAKYIKEEAEKLIGPVKQQPPRKTAPPPTREIPGNGNKPAPPRRDTQPAQAGDISAAKKAIQDRARRAGLLT